MFYDARCGMSLYSGFFNCMTYQPLPAYYSMVAFGQLYVRGTQVYVSDLPEGVYGCAAKGEDGCLVLANTTETDLEISLVLPGGEQITGGKIIREGAVWADVTDCDCLPANSVLLLQMA